MVPILAVIFILAQQPAYEGLGMKCISGSWLKNDSSHSLSQDSLLSDALYELQN